ncbi:hypothetical protein TVAG_385970 [Trichomonas vaginalis G3]|uniref:Uncharacterized protein n=1 Tax=Trichomonas vaginalis (strain ATCC PRA-98 / G3) TaxID=412133 RepID=A2FZN6_TRIV3|nr:phospholipase C/P1 nuclease family [Trichomonas vaginalis G3]EAX89627.1 hypothetical protein TVAG_385970 [Trichomonas vaginalis G3]KAI5553860.1 phospholipase C/P1 nuclease family [Trichomonas vaginalis G3]|eukprot:XP_001302557.1 hypothetical protein [Trichomonas vaginalis G3]
MLGSFEKSLFPQTIQGAWPINVAWKSYFGLFLEAFNPTNIANYYSNNHTEGDNNGKDFEIFYKGRKTNIHDFWGSLCGRLTGKYPFNSNVWSDIDKYAHDITLVYRNVTHYQNINDILTQSYNIAKDVVYVGVNEGEILSDEYVEKCYDVTSKQLASAAFSLADKQRTLGVVPPKIEYVKAPYSGSFLLGIWMLLLMFPFAIFIGWKAWSPRPRRTSANVRVLRESLLPTIN